MRNRRRIGELNKRIIIQEFNLEKDEYGDQVEKWSKWKGLWASMEIDGGREYWQSGQHNSETSGEIHIRYRPEINDRTMRVKYGNRYFAIQFHHHQKEAKQRTVLVVKELTPAEVKEGADE